jgi:SAM-dependent methyltransferase
MPSTASATSGARFIAITELAGDEITEEQLQRMVTRYVWAGRYCAGKDVLEVACGAGQGLRYLAKNARSLSAGDISPEILARTRALHGEYANISQFDAQSLPFPDASKDVAIIFEALYYVQDVRRFFSEVRRVLRPGGVLLIATANKDLFDFNPSPHSHVYLGVRELSDELIGLGFGCDFFGDMPTNRVSLRQRVFRPIKYLAVHLGLMPKTSHGKVWLKRLVFGRMVQMPGAVDENTRPYVAPATIDPSVPDRIHKVILCAARLSSPVS